ncbi:translation initiation factor IF-2 [Parasphaerochaeta coccoides]|uniref:Translation initiation factor IF-2 n=1 Tax=Parasphaerochaeta coccoides (strain ATCC BAA-1237 / DSM 17374 / SPN1) TaxID=760011 RepID=F4GK50_PARC1|nr:translation initiation factor IF-2 [Parasphaerochaeta coccoides]AEC01822.1 bacterial translation initiation factor 2 (bIF-2) [Parasphaerochaeta coccoides DSM 17374]
MSEETNKPKATLIKHNRIAPKAPVAPQREPSPSVSKETVAPESAEGRKRLVIKKKIVVNKPVAPQAPVVHETSTPSSVEAPVQATGQVPAPPTEALPLPARQAMVASRAGVSAPRPAQNVRQATAQPPKTSRTPSPRLINPHLHDGPVVSRPATNLPPVPGQGQTAADHAAWQSRRNEAQESSATPSGRRAAGTVGGRSMDPRPERTYGSPSRSFGDSAPRPSGGYQGGGGRPSGGYAPRPSSDGYQGSGGRPSGGYAPRPSSGGYQGSGGRPSGGYAPRPSSGGYQGGGGRPSGGYAPRPSGGYQGGRPGGTGPRPSGGYQGGKPGGFGPRPGGGRPEEAAPMDSHGQKGPAKKTFAKKKDATYKKRDSEQEMNYKFQQKRKAQIKTNVVPKVIDMAEVITVGDLAKKMNLKASELIAKLFSMGMMVTINQQIDSDTASLLAGEYGSEIHIVSLYDETLIPTEVSTPEHVLPRAPIVTVMGHVDHGKTKLLDAIRSTNVVAGEFGGITQHIGAYKIDLEGKRDIVFLDTPGHAAFTMMRARGAQVTDIVVLVVAANDGVMPQTLEAIDHAKAAKVPIIVAINKIDLADAHPDRVMQQLSDRGLVPEEWGGQTLYCKISALKKEGIDELLDVILLQADMLELTADPTVRAEGKVIESRIDQGRGIVASVLVQNGTLHQGDHYVAGIYAGRVRAMFDDKGIKIPEAGPSTPVEIIGLSDIPSAGDPFQVTEDEKQARQIGAKRQELERLGQSRNVKKVTLDNLYSELQRDDVKELNVVIKGDVQGSVEALQNALEDLSNNEIRLNIIRASAGAIIESDVSLASASNALIIGFNVRPTPRAQALADQEKIDIRKYNVIYDAVTDIHAAMEGMLTPDTKEVDIGTVEIRDIFKVPKVGIIAGSYVTEGKVKRNSVVRVIRDSIQINKSLVKITSLRRFKNDAREVTAGYECGIGLENFQDLKVGDILEVVETVEVAKKLDTLNT